jgi:hypothetical protein
VEQNKKLNVCLFSFKSAYNKEYKELLSNFNLRIIEIEKEEYCQILIESIKYNGILLDIPTLIKTSLQIKKFLANVERIYPTARIRYSKETNDMELMVMGTAGKITLQEFVEKHCRQFNARTMRQHGRIPINLNVTLFLEQEGQQVKMFCTTANISESGMFIMNKGEKLPIGAEVKIQILELGKENFLYGTVVRSLEWGEKLFHAPGFGIRINYIDREICDDYLNLTKTG